MTRSALIGCLVSLLLGVLVTALLLMPETPGGPLPFPHFDKLVHGIFFFVVALPALLGLGKRWHLAIWAVVTGYSGVIELLQPGFGRSAEWSDLAANALGAALALGLARWVLSKASKVQQRKRAKA